MRISARTESLLNNGPADAIADSIAAASGSFATVAASSRLSGGRGAGVCGGIAPADATTVRVTTVQSRSQAGHAEAITSVGPVYRGFRGGITTAGDGAGILRPR
jgi:hypothetical protein